MFLILTQPRGDQVAINLDHVRRIWPAEEGGVGLTFKEGDGSSYIYRESYKDVIEYLELRGLSWVERVPVNSNHHKRAMRG